MKLHRPKTLTALLTALATVAFVATDAAHAFTIDLQSGTNPDGSAKYVDPDEQFENFTSGKNAFGLSNGFLNFDLRPFSAPDQRGPLFTPGYPAFRTLTDH
ncbi:MAG TPA: hypothetical protein VEH02_00655 [Pseudolabrys sp.]|nr:hypothetical protein [Pseudolabrys sp.]